MANAARVRAGPSPPFTRNPPHLWEAQTGDSHDGKVTSVTYLPVDDHFTVISADNDSDRSKWLGMWSSWPDREVFAHPAYVDLFAAPGDRVYCAAWNDGSACVLYPFILRPVEIGGPIPSAAVGATDVTSPYGYGGPYFWGAGTATLPTEFWRRFDEWALDRRVVSEFVRFHLKADRLLGYPGLVSERQQNIIRDLPLDFSDIWTDVEHKVRKNVRKATDLGVWVESDAAGRHLPAFLDIYRGTMLRRKATHGYMFPSAFFQQLHASLAGQFIYFLAHYEDAVVAAELVLISERTIYSFLGGTSSDSFDVRPNDLLKYEIMRWGHAQGKSSFVLGGGFEEGDGIFRYKRSFAPRGCTPFRVGQRVLDRAAYDCLVKARRLNESTQGSAWTPRPGFFPEYRG